MSPTSPIQLPRLAAIARHATPHLLEATLIPLGLFYGGLQLFGLWGALLAALIWSSAEAVQPNGVKGAG